MKALCRKCGLAWNVSVHSRFSKKGYICPRCTGKVRVKKSILLAAGFIASCLLSMKCSEIATAQRGYQVIVGGEDFIPLIYLAALIFIKTVSDIKKESTCNGAN